MSSAAVQPSAATVSNRQYQASSHGRDQYYPQQSPNGPSAPSSSRRHASRPSNGSSPYTAGDYYSPAQTSTSSSTTPRAAGTTTMSSEGSGASGGAQIQPPPRSSSNHHRSSTATAPATDAYTPRSSAAVASPPIDSPSFADFPEPGTADPDSARRRAQQPTRETSHSGRSKQSSGQSRSQPPTSRPPMGEDLPRENSTIINRLVASDPQEDIARERARVAESRGIAPATDLTPITGLGLVGSEGVDDGGRGAGASAKQKPEKTSRKETRFGEYILGQTLGEGEFGKVKMGWKRDGGVQVAIKLIRKDSLGNNPSRLPKIYREIAILRGLQHPNIVRLHEMVETERHIGIILEYASGGELFDYILQHRFLKDNAARRLFAQLVSGVGYLHKKGIVHRDLKLENLLLDRNRNIIITDFGFANTFNPKDELGEEIEYRLGDRDFVKKIGLEQLGPDGHRKGDLMQTSCGSPCYAAPELVVSDSLYTGRKVDVWSCGVILYAMLAGYLPFDDDPANPEGDNINLLYKYIVSTPLTFPEYVTPHARDLLKRILVPDPRKRADLFEVARHSWLSEYAHVVGFITSSTTTTNDIANTTVAAENVYEPPHLSRSASVREPTKAHLPVAIVSGGAAKVDQTGMSSAEKAKASRDAKRRTVQVEYVAPQSSTLRGEAPSKTKARGTSTGPIEISSYQPGDRRQPSGVPSAAAAQTRSARDQQRATSEHVGAAGLGMSSATRPATQGSMTGRVPLPSRGSYGSPSVGVSQDAAQGRFSQPEKKSYTGVANGVDGQHEQQSQGESYGDDQQPASRRDSFQPKGHKRSNTIGERIGSLFNRNSMSQEEKQEKAQEKRERKERSKYPPTSMKGPIANNTTSYVIPSPASSTVDAPRKSTESRRTSFSFGRKATNPDVTTPTENKRSSRRFSFIPSGLKNIGGGGGNRNSQVYSMDPPGSASGPPPSTGHSNRESRGRFGLGRSGSRSPSRSTTESQHNIPVNVGGYSYDEPRGRNLPPAPTSNPYGTYPSYKPTSRHTTNDENMPPSDPVPPGTSSSEAFHPPSAGANNPYRASVQPNPTPRYPEGFNPGDDDLSLHGSTTSASGPRKPATLQKHKRFTDAYESETSSGSGKRVMDFFRRMGKTRGEAYGKSGWM